MYILRFLYFEIVCSRVHFHFVEFCGIEGQAYVVFVSRVRKSRDLCFSVVQSVLHCALHGTAQK